MTSIRVRLLKWLIGPILLINLAGAALTYTLAWTPAQLAFDQGLFDVAGALAARLPLDASAVPAAPDANADPVYFVMRGAGGAMLAGDADFPPLRLGPAGPLAYDAVMRGEPVRVATVAANAGGRQVSVGVAKPLRKRLALRADIVGSLLWLGALFTVVLAGLIWLSVTNGLLPLARMRANLDARGGADLAPIGDQGVPFELAPVVSAFNGLLGKVQAGAKSQHDFLADVAHQLRTPLAGVKLQLEWLGARHAADPETLRSLRLMLLSNERMIRQTNQLLALARAEPSRFQKTRLEPLDLGALVAESVQYFVDEAGKKHIDLGFDLAPATVAGERFLLRDLVDNLVDNAVRYTPPHGTVTVRCRMEGGAGLLEIEDSGPGIALEKRGAVFSRFVRLDEKSAGSGLGLAIVRDIAAAHGAAIALDDMPGGAGMRVAVRFPQSPEV